MKKAWLKLWHDQSGSIPALSWMFLVTIIVIGAIVGLVTLRDQLVQEYGDLAVALDSLDQSWQVNEWWGRGVVEFVDEPSFEQPVDPTGAEPAGLSVREEPLAEGDELLHAAP